MLYLQGPTGVAALPPQLWVVAFCDWLLSLSAMFLRFIDIVA